MDATTQYLMLVSGYTPLAQFGTMTWAGKTDSSVTLTPGSTTYTTSGNAVGNHVYGDAFPTIDDLGLYLDVQLLHGYNSSPTRVAWLGVCNTTSAFTYSQRLLYTGWYWSGAIWYPSTTDSTNATPLTASTYRIALRTESGVVKFYIKKTGGVTRGPFPVPTGTLRLMMLSQSGYLLPEATILNSGAIYQGGGGLF